jgi:hypothetical protein
MHFQKDIKSSLWVQVAYISSSSLNGVPVRRDIRTADFYGVHFSRIVSTEENSSGRQ